MKSSLAGLLAFLIPFAICLASNSGLSAQDAQPLTTVEVLKLRQDIEGQFRESLKTLEQWGQANGIADATSQIGSVFLTRDPDRLYVFLPTEIHDTSTTDSADAWTQRLVDAKRQHASALLDLARTVAKSGNGADAFQLVHESLYWDPALAAAREALGHRKTDDGWQPYSERLKIKRATRAYPLLGWGRDNYWQCSTDNFDIYSTADEATTQRLAEQLQRWHWVWQQVFFDHWSNAKVLDRWLDGKGQSRGSPRKYQVVLFASRDEYIDELSPMIKGIAASTGFYNDQVETSFFYASEEVSVEETWRHELTHQLFKESTRTDRNPFQHGYLWLGEGIAMYMESLKDFGPFATLGGFDARRLQYARTRQFRENFQISIQELNAMSMDTFQQHPELRRIYSQAAGLTQFFMQTDDGRYRRSLIDLLSLIYEGRLKDDSFARMMGDSEEAFDKQYPEYLKVSNETVCRFLLGMEAITELCLPDVRLDNLGFQRVGECVNLQWLDCSGSTLTAKRVESLAECQRLDQLLAHRCTLEQGAVNALGKLVSLKSLELTGSELEAGVLQEFATLDQVEDLSLGGTNVDDSAIDALSAMKSLTSIGLGKTRVSPQGLRRLQQARPGIRITESP